MKQFFLTLSLCLFAMFECLAATEYELYSPDKKISLRFSLNEKGTPQYQLSYQDRLLLKPSTLGLKLQNIDDLTEGFTIEEITRETRQRKWEQVWGEQREVWDHHNELQIHLRESASAQRKLVLTFRLFNDGLGFRYEIPKQPDLSQILIEDECTTFAFAENWTSWSIGRDFDSFEHPYRSMPLSELEDCNTPVTLVSEDGLCVAIHEAALTNYAGMALVNTVEDTLTLKSDLAPWPDGLKVRAQAPLTTPWRTILVAPRQKDLLLSTLILNLNEPNTLEDTSWIEPMKYMGIWWAMHIDINSWHPRYRLGATTDNAKRYIRAAADLGIKGLVVEGWNKGWETFTKANDFNFTKDNDDYSIRSVASYAKKHGIALIAHHETGSDVPAYEAQMENAFDLLEKLGIHALKTGYVGKIKPEGHNHHGQFMVNHHQRVINIAAEHKVMLNIHEPIKSTGLRRTYPNMMTSEGVRGMEYNAWSSTGNSPEHTTVIPFTRGLGGPIDYTPGIFDLLLTKSPRNKSETKYRVRTTLAKQLALYVVIYSPLQMAADLPENYEKHLPAFEFIRDVPTTWDETRVFAGVIGDYLIMMRRAEKDWYIGAITDEEARTFDMPLDFLDSGTYAITLYRDEQDAHWQKNPAAYVTEHYLVNAQSTLPLDLKASGGCAAHIREATPEQILQLEFLNTR